MKYLRRLFESEENMVDNIREVFQDMEDFELTLECDKMWEGVVQLEQPYNLQGYTVRKSTDTFYGYFIDGLLTATEWLDGNGFSIADYYDNPIGHVKNLTLNELKSKEYFYKVSLSGEQEHVGGDFQSIRSEIKNNILRLKNMYDLRLHRNTDECYKNGIIYDVHGSHIIMHVDWLSNNDKVSIPRTDSKCQLGIYLK
jgi:hypothetical protein